MISAYNNINNKSLNTDSDLPDELNNMAVLNYLSSVTLDLQN